MDEFILEYLCINNKLIVSREMAESIANYCLPVFFDSKYPVYMMNWDSVIYHNPVIFRMSTMKVNAKITEYLDNNNKQKAWYYDYFAKR